MKASGCPVPGGLAGRSPIAAVLTSKHSGFPYDAQRKRYKIYTSLKEYYEKSLHLPKLYAAKIYNEIATFYKISASFSHKKNGES
jgi:hypothetical protein